MPYSSALCTAMLCTSSIGCINDKSEEFPGELDSLIADTAKTGIVRYCVCVCHVSAPVFIIARLLMKYLFVYLHRLPWDLLKPLFNYRLKKVCVTYQILLEIHMEFIKFQYVYILCK